MKQLKAEYDKHNGFTLELLKKLFTGMRAYERMNKKTKKFEPSISLTIKNKYYCNAIMLVCRLNKFPYDVDDKSYELASELFAKAKSVQYFTFEKAIEITNEEKLLLGLEWFHKQILFGFSILDKYIDNSIAKKKKVSSILEEL
jgi:hypothetical protein